MLGDHLGSTSVLLNQDGTVAKQEYYCPFGGNRGNAFSDLTTKRFTGQYHEPGLPGGEGLSYCNGRWYDAQLGRFLNADTLVPNPGNPQNFNRFSYVNNNPLRFIDPSGHRPCEGTDYCAPPARPSTAKPKPSSSQKTKHADNSASAVRAETRSIQNARSWQSTPQRRLMSAVLRLMNRLEAGGLIRDPYIRQWYRSPEEAHRFSTAFTITSGQADANLLRAHPVDIDGNIWFSENWLYADSQCVYEPFRCGATMWNAARNSSETVIDSTCDSYDCYPVTSYALEGYPQGDSRRLPNNDNLAVSNHIYGLAIDVGGDWQVDPWSRAIDNIIVEYGLSRPYGPRNSRPEPWHFELE